MERIGIAGMKILIGLYKAKEHKATSLKEIARIADVGMSQVYSRLPILEKLGYIKIYEYGPRKIEIVLTDSGRELAEILYTVEKKIFKDYYEKVVVKTSEKP